MLSTCSRLLTRDGGAVTVELCVPRPSQLPGLQTRCHAQASVNVQRRESGGSGFENRRELHLRRRPRGVASGSVVLGSNSFVD